ncbi:MAG TPA: nucleotide disphospho-sugar-binding domain-containing protein, partial [Rhodoblastus sp.]|nr:nucleotide disphospho-sugar-binding domain-containing protein [Rhodoblastus sp.]
MNHQIASAAATMLAAYGRIPVLAVGGGYVLPPAHLPRMPALLPGRSDMPDEPTLLANAAAVQRQRKLPAPHSLPSLIGGAAHAVCTYPETDVYADLRAEPASGPLESSSRPLGRPERKAVFAYLAADVRPTARLLQVLAKCGFPVEVFVRDLPDRMKSALRVANVRVHETPPPLAEVAERSSLIVHHGGIGTAETALALGRPQFLLPKHLEQSLNAANLVRLGVAMRLEPNFSL